MLRRLYPRRPPDLRFELDARQAAEVSTGMLRRAKPFRPGTLAFGNRLSFLPPKTGFPVIRRGPECTVAGFTVLRRALVMFLAVLDLSIAEAPVARSYPTTHGEPVWKHHLSLPSRYHGQQLALAKEIFALTPTPIVTAVHRWSI